MPSDKKIELSVRDSLTFSDSAQIARIDIPKPEKETITEPLYKSLDPVIYWFENNVAYMGIVTAAVWRPHIGWIYRVRCGIDDSARLIPEKDIVSVKM